MSFVISESKRELDFLMNQQRSVNNSLGPGSYYTPSYYENKNSKVPFGNGSRRRINSPNSELMQDLLQFRIIPHKNSVYVQNQTLPEVSFNKKPNKSNNKQKQQVRQKNLNQQYQQIKRIQRPQIETHPQLLQQLNINKPNSNQTKTKKKSSQTNSKLADILGILNLKKGSVSIQSEKVKVLADSDEEDDENDESNGFFLTQQPSKSQNVSALSNIKQGEIKKPIYENEGTRKRQDQKILKWKYYDQSKKQSNNNNVMKEKKMDNVGPGSYEVSRNVQVNPIYKLNPSANFISNTSRLQEMINLKKQQNTNKHQVNDMDKSYSQLSININENDVKQRSQSQISQLSLYKKYKNGLVKESSTADNFDIYRSNQNQQPQKERLELVNKEQRSLPSVGPGTYHVSNQLNRQPYDNLNNTVSNNSVNGRFNHLNKTLEVSRQHPGPGSYDYNVQQKNSIKNYKFPSFGISQQRELQLYNNDKIGIPGPGKYQTDFNLENLLKTCNDKKLVNAVLDCTQDRKNNYIFKSKQPQTAVFDIDKKKSQLEGLHQYYTQDLNTISQKQYDNTQKRLEKHILSNQKNVPGSQIIDTFQTVDKRFKEDKNLLEQSNIGPGYYDTIEKERQKNKNNQGYSIFKSKVPRDLSKQNKKHQDADTSFQDLQEEQQTDYKVRWDKKSFNLKYSRANILSDQYSLKFSTKKTVESEQI